MAKYVNFLKIFFEYSQFRSCIALKRFKICGGNVPEKRFLKWHGAVAYNGRPQIPNVLHSGIFFRAFLFPGPTNFLPSLLTHFPYPSPLISPNNHLLP